MYNISLICELHYIHSTLYIPTKINDKFTNFTHLTFTMWRVFWEFYLCDCDLVTYSFFYQINLSKGNCNLLDWLPGGGGVLSEKLSRGVRPASQNPYPIYD